MLKVGLIGHLGRLGQAIGALHPVIPIDKGAPRTGIDCDVIIDVSSPAALIENLAAQKPIVIGTTGHLDLKPIRGAAQHVPVFYAPNFSLGAALLKRLSQYVVKHFIGEIDLIETHHTQKKDAPSGTALQLARDLPNVHIHSIRSGNVIGEHTLIFNNDEERLTLSHNVHTRAAFAKGALAAAHFIVKQAPGLYGMDNLFDSL